MGIKKKTSKKKSSGKGFFRHWSHEIHLWVGLAVCLPMLLIGITGTILVYEHEINDWIARNSADYVLATDGDAHHASKVIAAAQAQNKDGYTATAYLYGIAGEKPAKVTFSSLAKKEEQIQSYDALMDIVSLEVLKTEQKEQDGFFRFVLDIHANMLLDKSIGRPFVGFLGLFLLVLSITGIVIWWPKNGKWKRALTIKRGKNGVLGLRFNRDLHGVFGICTYVILFVTAFSGVYIAFPNQTGAVIKVFFPVEKEQISTNELKVEPLTHGASLSLAAIAKLAEQAAGDDLRIIFIRAPRQASQPHRVMMKPNDTMNGPFTSVFIDPWKQNVMHIDNPRDYSAGKTVMAWQRSLHGAHGTADWWWWKIASFVMGLTLTMFCITGFYMWWIKRKL